MNPVAQRTAALEVANQRRNGCAASRRRIAKLPTAQGLEALAQLIRDPSVDESAGKVGYWLRAPHGMGVGRCDRLIFELRLNPQRRLRDLTVRQVNMLADSVANGYRTPVNLNRFGVPTDG